MLVSASLPLANLASDSDDISIVAHQPPLVKNAFWGTGPTLNPYPQPRDRAYTSILRADPFQLAALQPKRADGHHIVYDNTESSNNARFGRRLSFGSSAALTPLAALDNSYEPGCKHSESIDVESNSSQNLPQLNFDKALSFLEVNQSKEAPLDRRHDISVQSLSGICSSSSLANNRNKPPSNGILEQRRNCPSQLSQ
ncbi:hypothetical protein LPJ57_008224 [Coemansia sp. RSA 486]|nr:hypothetical protein LPJ57_008224 [Coemansia sp. RSA 486]